MTVLRINPTTGNLDLVGALPGEGWDGINLQVKFDANFRDFDMWVLTNTVLNSNNQIELAPL